MKTALVTFVIRMTLAQFGTYDRAVALADSCETPTSWVELTTDNNGAPHWIAVCGTADGRVCGADVPWTHYDCQESNACTVNASDYLPEECD